MSEQFNQIFKKLVLDTDTDSAERLIGMLAYAEYKLQKQEYHQNYHSEYGNDPGEEQVSEFIRAFNDRILDKLRNDSTDTLVTFAEELMKESVQENIHDILSESILDEVKNNNSKSLQEVKKQNSKFSSFLISLMASIVFSLLVFFGAAAVTMHYPDSLVAKIYKAITDNTVEMLIVPVDK